MTFATNGTYEAPVTGAMLGEAVQTEMDEDARANGFVGTEVICADHLNYEIDEARCLAAEWGDGADGSLHITGGSFTLTRDYSFTTVSFGSGHAGVINTNGWTLRARHLDLRNAQAGAIQCDGAPGSAGSVGDGAGFGGSLPPGKPGATNGLSAASVFAVIGGVGGHGGGVAVVPLVAAPVATTRLRRAKPAPVWASLGGSAGVRPFGSDPVAKGGGGGGYVAVRAGKITIDGTTWGAAIRANGGNGQNGSSAVSATVGLGGGGGGGGGVIDIVAGGIVGSTANNVLRANGGTGGTGGNATAGGVESGNGGGGGDGGLISVRIGTVVTVHIGGTGAAGILGGVGSAGAGGPGGECEAGL